MSALTTAAANALASQREAERVALETAKTQFRTDARVAVATVIAPLTFATANLVVVDIRVPDRLVVVGDGTVNLGATLEPRPNGPEAWRVRVVYLEDGQWRSRGGIVTSLAELGAVLGGVG